MPVWSQKWWISKHGCNHTWTSSTTTNGGRHPEPHKPLYFLFHEGKWQSLPHAAQKLESYEWEPRNGPGIQLLKMNSFWADTHAAFTCCVKHNELAYCIERTHFPPISIQITLFHCCSSAVPSTWKANPGGFKLRETWFAEVKTWHSQICQLWS